MARDKEKHKEAKRRWYVKNRPRIRERMNAHSKQNKKNVWDWFQDYKKRIVCVRCPENHPDCLQFHHREPSEKSFAISDAVRAGIRIARILVEIGKCDVLCANCHAKHHYLFKEQK